MASVIEAITIDNLGSTAMRFSWTGTAGKVASIYIDGAVIASALEFSGTDRFYDYSRASSYDAFSLDISEHGTGETPNSINMVPEINPVIRWRDAGSDDVVQYLIYAREYGGTATVIESIPRTEGVTWFATRTRKQRSHGWNYFEVRAVNKYGDESTVQETAIYVVDIQPKVSAISMSGASGTFTISYT